MVGDIENEKSLYLCSKKVRFSVSKELCERIKKKNG